MHQLIDTAKECDDAPKPTCVQRVRAAFSKANVFFWEKMFKWEILLAVLTGCVAGTRVSFFLLHARIFFLVLFSAIYKEELRVTFSAVELAKKWFPVLLCARLWNLIITYFRMAWP